MTLELHMGKAYIVGRRRGSPCGYAQGLANMSDVTLPLTDMYNRTGSMGSSFITATQMAMKTTPRLAAAWPRRRIVCGICDILRTGMGKIAHPLGKPTLSKLLWREHGCVRAH